MPVICTCTNETCGNRVIKPCGSELYFVGNIEEIYPKFCEKCGAPMTRENHCNETGGYFTTTFVDGVKDTRM